MTNAVQIAASAAAAVEGDRSCNESVSVNKIDFKNPVARKSHEFWERMTSGNWNGEILVGGEGGGEFKDGDDTKTGDSNDNHGIDESVQSAISTATFIGTNVSAAKSDKNMNKMSKVYNVTETNPLATAIIGDDDSLAGKAGDRSSLVERTLIEVKTKREKEKKQGGGGRGSKNAKKLEQRIKAAESAAKSAGGGGSAGGKGGASGGKGGVGGGGAAGGSRSSEAIKTKEASSKTGGKKGVTGTGSSTIGNGGRGGGKVYNVAETNPLATAIIGDDDRSSLVERTLTEVKTKREKEKKQGTGSSTIGGGKSGKGGKGAGGDGAGRSRGRGTTRSDGADGSLSSEGQSRTLFYAQPYRTHKGTDSAPTFVPKTWKIQGW